VVPLAVATGAGAEMRQSLGTAVFFGMLGVTLFGLLFTPTFYAVVRQLSGNASSQKGRIDAPARSFERTGQDDRYNNFACERQRTHRSFDERRTDPQRTDHAKEGRAESPPEVFCGAGEARRRPPPKTLQS
jgi:hypothetical protein